MNPGLDSLDEMVRQLWPRYKDSVQPMWDTRLHGYSIDEIRTALWRHKADYPDDSKPTWKTIYTMLSGGKTGAGKSDLQLLLDGIRREIAKDPRWQKHPTARRWSDSEVFENHVEANTRPILRRMDGTAEDDPEGRLARLAATERTNIVSRYVRDLEERGDSVPAWLVC
jgi:hypothetical protein